MKKTNIKNIVAKCILSTIVSISMLGSHQILADETAVAVPVEPTEEVNTATSENDKIANYFAQIRSDALLQHDSSIFPDVYAHFCEDNETVQSMIDYYNIANNRRRDFIEKMYQYDGSMNTEEYRSNSYSMPRRSFPLLNWNYNSITWADEQMKFYYLVLGSWAALPIYNITPTRTSKESPVAPTGRLVMVIPTGSDHNYLDVDVPFYQNDCKQDNFCEKDLNAVKPYRTLTMVVRDEDNSCYPIHYKLSRIDIENIQQNEFIKNEIRFNAPHGNFRFEIMDKNWSSRDGRVKGSFTYDLNTLTIDGVTYKMIPGGTKAFGASIWYLKAQGKPFHERWLYMYGTGDTDDVYCGSSNPKCHRANKVVVTLFNDDFDNITDRFALYVNK